MPDCNQGVTMPHNHTNKYSCHWAHRRLCCQNKQRIIILLFQTKFKMIFCHYFLSLLCLFIHQGHQPLLLSCASFHISCKNCCWGYNLEEAESLVFGGVLETYLAHSFIAKYPATAGANHYTTATVQILSSHRGMRFISAIE